MCHFSSRTKNKIKRIIKAFTPPVFLKIYSYSKNATKNNTHQIIETNNSNVERKIETNSVFNLSINSVFNTISESIIIGNGPSLKTTIDKHLIFFNNKVKFCVNEFALSEYFDVIKPDFYVFADPFYWDPNCPEVHKKDIFSVIENINKSVTWDMYILLPQQAKNWNYFQKLPNESTNIKIMYFNSFTTVPASENKFMMYKNNEAMIRYQTVLVATIFISLNLGFKTTYIVGADMSLHENVSVNWNNVVCNNTTQLHFFDEPKIQFPFWKDGNGAIFKMDELFAAFALMFKGFLELEEYSKFLGVKIYNASSRSFIDAFERYKI